MLDDVFHVMCLETRLNVGQIAHVKTRLDVQNAIQLKTRLDDQHMVLDDGEIRFQNVFQHLR